jgi:site-specific DNA recombinase
VARTLKNSGSKHAGGDGSGTSARVVVVAGYLRVSTDEQAKSGLGLGDQRHRISAMAQAKGWPEPVWYVDEGISGTKDSAHRPDFARLRADVKAGVVQAVITLDISRIARKMRVLMDFMEEIEQAHTHFISCKESFDTSTPQGQFVLYMWALVAQLERDMIAQRVRGALAEHSRRDGEAGGGMPYGYVRREKRLHVVPPEARIVRRIFIMREQKMTLRAIAAELNRRRYSSPRGGKWHHSSVQAVLANAPYYRGGLRGASALTWPVILRSE